MRWDRQADALEVSRAPPHVAAEAAPRRPSAPAEDAARRMKRPVGDRTLPTEAAPRQ